MRLIDADELIEEMRGYGRGVADANIDKWTMIISEAMVNKAKTVDAVPVVRCKDCKNLSMTTLGMPYACWHKAEGVWGHDGTHATDVVCTRIDDIEHYCGYGERKTDGTDDD